jgi:hypothetical protein
MATLQPSLPAERPPERWPPVDPQRSFLADAARNLQGPVQRKLR